MNLQNLQFIDWFSLIQTITLIITALFVKKYTEETKKSNVLTARISEADFILRLNKDIFTERFNELFELIESNLLIFDEEKFCFNELAHSENEEIEPYTIQGGI